MNLPSTVRLSDSIKRRMLETTGNVKAGDRAINGSLLLLSIAYGALVRRRAQYYSRRKGRVRRLPCWVISIGNLTAGGTGKTPATLHLSAALGDMGYRVVILSRGYKGSAEQQGALVSDGRSLLLRPEQAGDEPYLMASLQPNVPVIVGADRYASGRLAIKLFRPEIILLDDGFQHLSLYRDLNILLLDARAPLGNGYLLPRGLLREPPEALRRADAIIYTRADAFDRGLCSGAKRLDHCGNPVFYCRHRPLLRRCVPKGRACDPQTLAAEQKNGDFPASPMFAFSGLAHNETFRDSVTAMGGIVAGARGFRDHHAYTQGDVAEINQAALQSGSRFIVTTDKDYVRVPPHSRFSLDLLVIGVEIEFGKDKERWRQFINRWISERGGYA